MDDKKVIIKTRLLDYGIPTNNADLLSYYAVLLIDANKTINLTRITSEEDVVLKHLIDSLTAEKYIETGKSVLDVGTGGGLPGIPIAICRPDLKVTLLDSTENKINQVKGFITKLDLNCSTLLGRAEDLSHTALRETFDVVISRAVAPLNILTEICAPFIKKKGLFIAYKGKNAEEEVNEAKNVCAELGLSEYRVINTNIGDLEHKLVIADKNTETYVRYPRTWAKIKKAPLH